MEQLTRDVLAAKPPPQTIEEISAEVLQRCTVLDAPIFVSLGRGRGAKKIENFHSRSEPDYRGSITCRIALGESRNTAAMRAGAPAVDHASRGTMPAYSHFYPEGARSRIWPLELVPGESDGFHLKSNR